MRRANVPNEPGLSDFLNPEGSTIMLPPNSDLLRYLESPTFVAPAGIVTDSD